MPWYIGTAIGSICLTIVHYICKSNPITITSFCIVTAPLLVCNLGFWYGFQNSANFLQTYFTGSALSVLAGLGLSLLVFDKSISLLSLAGVVMIVIGQQLLVR